MGFLDDYKPERLEDFDSDFKPIKGAFVARIADIGRNRGTSERTGAEYDFYFINAQVTEVIEGDKGLNRYLKLTFNDAKKLADVLFTAGLPYATETEEAFDASLENLRDKSINIRAWVAPKVTKNDAGEWVPVEPREDVQRLRVVAEFKSASKKTEVSADTPF